MAAVEPADRYPSAQENLSLTYQLFTIMYDCELSVGVYCTRGSCRPGVSNSHTKLMPRRFYEPVYFQTHFRAIFSGQNRVSNVRSMRYQKGKLNVIKRQKIIFRSVSFADLFVEFKRYSMFAPKPFKNILVLENAVKVWNLLIPGNRLLIVRQGLFQATQDTISWRCTARPLTSLNQGKKAIWYTEDDFPKSTH